MSKRVKIFRAYTSEVPDTIRVECEINNFIESYASDVIDIKTTVKPMIYTSTSHDYNHKKITAHSTSFILICTLIYIPLEKK